MGLRDLINQTKANSLMGVKNTEEIKAKFATQKASEAAAESSTSIAKVAPKTSAMSLLVKKPTNSSINPNTNTPATIPNAAVSSLVASAKEPEGVSAANAEIVKPQTLGTALAVSDELDMDALEAIELLESEPDQDITAAEFVHPSQPDEMSEAQINALKQSVAVIRDHMDEPDLVAQNIMYVMQSLQQHPFLQKHMADEDMMTMVRGLRMSYGTQIEIKEVKGRAKREKQADADDFISALGDLANIKF